MDYSAWLAVLPLEDEGCVYLTEAEIMVYFVDRRKFVPNVMGLQITDKEGNESWTEWGLTEEPPKLLSGRAVVPLFPIGTGMKNTEGL